MKVIPFIYNDEDDLMANTYVVIDNKDCIVIDPSKAYEGIVQYIIKNGLTLKAILLTHGHFDHMRGIDILVNTFHAPLYIGFYDEPNLLDARKNLSTYMNDENLIVQAKALTVFNKEVIKVLSEDIEVIETPFHTKGSVCYYLKDSKLLFSGDTLFKLSIGRDDLPGSEPRQKMNSLKKLMMLPNDVKVYPGHGGFTNIYDEKMHNPFVK